MAETRSKSAAKSKNKVTPSKPRKSTSFQLPKDLSDDGASVSSSVSTSSTSRTPLPLNVQKQLAEDIESEGGIRLFAGSGSSDLHLLERLCNTREDTYGVRGDPLRRKIQQKVYRWANSDKKGQYQKKVLDKLGVKSNAQLKEEEAKRNDSDENHSSISSGEVASSKASSFKVASSTKVAPVKATAKVAKAPV